MDRPEWLKKGTIRVELDARPLLATGQHPLERVTRETEALQQGEIYVILTPFVPEPMIAKIGSMGFETFTEEEPGGIVRTYFCRKTWTI